MRISNSSESSDGQNKRTKEKCITSEISSHFSERKKSNEMETTQNQRTISCDLRSQQSPKEGLPSNCNFHKFHSKISFGRRRQLFSPCNRNSSFGKWKKNDQNSLSRGGKDPAFRKKVRDAAEFRYGNYHQYYGYRNQGNTDSRLQCMKREWFSGKDVLDIGCNAGHFTLAIAQTFTPKCIIGVDIDQALVKMAMRNVRHYIKYEDLSDEDFPISLPLSYGPVAQAFDPKIRYPPGSFPFNVQFVQGNYILPSDEMLEWQEPYFDTVLCLSLTKWIHLNFGDVGVKRLFHRIHAQLRPGGYLILEAQAFHSYAKKKKITEELFHHYNEIQLFPEMFNEYLLNEVGFESCELIDTPAHSSKGFSRPIYLFMKGKEPEETKDSIKIKGKQKHIIYNYSSDSHCEYSDVEQLSE